MTAKVLLLPGDGIGVEVIAQCKPILDLLKTKFALEYEEADFGGIAIDKYNDPLPADTLNKAKEADAILLGAIGAPQYDSLPVDKKPEKGLLKIRYELAVFANLRPAISFKELTNVSSLKTEIINDLDILIIRELTGGLYFSEPRGIKGDADKRIGFNTMQYSVEEIKRIAKIAFTSAQKRNKKLCSIDKANVLEVSMLWREVVTDLAKDYPDVELSHMLVDNAAMQLVANPKQFDVIVTGNIFGDILSDLASQLVGSIGMLPSASIGDKHGLYEPVHGSAPDIAGKDMANPCATILSLALLLEHSLQEKEYANKLTQAVKDVLASGLRTADIIQEGEEAVSCSAMGAAILVKFKELL